MVAVAIAAAARGQMPDRRPIALEHITVIDVETGDRRSDQTVIVAGARIAAVGASRQFGIAVLVS